MELYRLTNSVEPEPEGSSPHSQQPANGPYPEPGESTPHPQPISLRSILIPSSNLRLGLPSCLLSFRLSHQNPVHVSPFSHACHMPRPPHSPWFVLPNIIWWWVQIMKLPILQLSQFSRYIIPPESKWILRTRFVKWSFVIVKYLSTLLSREVFLCGLLSSTLAGGTKEGHFLVAIRTLHAIATGNTWVRISTTVKTLNLMNLLGT
jgi:hypothetical protein